jgi:hypothetical protein
MKKLSIELAAAIVVILVGAKVFIRRVTRPFDPPPFERVS